jgi:hypothetical protein
MLEITKKALTLEPQEVMELERIIIDDDREGAFQFLKKIFTRDLFLRRKVTVSRTLMGVVTM